MLHSGANAVGPNAIVQTAGALRDIAEVEATYKVFDCAGLASYIADPPQRMVPQEQAATLFQAVRSQLTIAKADAVLAESGRRTAHYIIEHRIPKAVSVLLRILPAPIAARLLLTAIQKHAWTFAGSGSVCVGRGRSLWLEIAGNPLATPGCPWHMATLQELFRVTIAAGARVHHSDCCARGAKLCRFDFELTAAPRVADPVPKPPAALA